MKSRSNLVITAGIFCHLFLLPLVVTSQLPSSPTATTPPECTVHTFTKPTPGHARDPVTIQAGQCEKNEEVYKLHGEGEIDFQNYIIRADEMTYNDESGDVTATGNVRLDGGEYDTHVEASHGTYNVQSGTGRFYDVYGTTGMRFKAKNVILTTSNPFAFTGKWVEKVSPTRLIVHHGTVTSCQLPKPKWTFNARKVVVDIGGEAKIFNSTFRVKGVPAFYFPFAEHPVERVARQTGFLIPSIGQSTVKGTILGDSFFWAINRSIDATLGVEYYSSRGIAQQGNFRMRPNANTYLDVNYFGVLDRGIPTGTTTASGTPVKVNQGGEDLRVNGITTFGHGYRAILSAEYLSRYVFRAAFEENFALAVVSEVNSVLFLSRNSNGFSFNADAGKYQNFQSTTPGDLITLIHAPGLNTSSVDRKIRGTPFYWGYDVAGEGLSRRTPTFTSADLVSRLDVHPRLSLPLFLRGWTFDPEIAARNTYYTQRQMVQDSGRTVAVNDPINRRDIEAAFELRPPTMVRVFQKPVLGRKLKHVIEPRLTYRYVNGIENFNGTIRFDERDILSDSNSLQLSVMNRLYMKPKADKKCANDIAKGDERVCPSRAREFLSWEISGKYFFDPSFGGALVPGTRNVLSTTEDLTGIAFLTEPRNFSPIVSRLRLQMPGSIGLQWNLDYDTKKGHITGSSIFLEYRVATNIFFSGSHSLLQAPGELLSATGRTATTQFNQFRILTGYGNPSRRGINAAMNFGFDANANRRDPITGIRPNLPFLQYSAFQTSYNWDCCGVTFEYRRFALGTVRNENLYRFAFNVANIGTFGNLKRQERIF